MAFFKGSIIIRYLRLVFISLSASFLFSNSASATEKYLSVSDPWKTYAERKKAAICPHLPAYCNLIIKQSIYYNVNPSVIAAIILHESKGDWKATGSKGDAGLMQVMNYNFPDHLKGKPERYNPHVNIKHGILYFKKYCLSQHASNLERALSCYNRGPSRGAPYNVEYVKKVLMEFSKIERSESQYISKLLNKKNSL